MKYQILSLLAGLVLSAQALTIPNGAEADLVLGEPYFGCDENDNSLSVLPTATSLCEPQSVVVDPVTRKVFVADWGNSRILRYPSAVALASRAAAEFAFGQPSLAENIRSNGANSIVPVGLFIDPIGRLWVADTLNNRVLMFNAAGTRSNSIPDKIFGQPDAMAFARGNTAAKMYAPTDVCVDSADRLWVADSYNNRVLRFDAVSTKASGAAADGVLGQAGFTTRDMRKGSTGFGYPAGVTTTRGMRKGSTGFEYPAGVTVSSSGALYVTCISEHRVLRFDNAGALPDGAFASAVLGQPNFATTSSGSSAVEMSSPSGAWITADDSLWVSDRANHRLLRFNNASTKQSGAAADGVVKPQDFVNGSPYNTGISPVRKPFVDTDGRLWVADSMDNRVLRFSPDTTPPVLVVKTALKRIITKPVVTISGTASDAYGILKVEYRIGEGPLKLATGTTPWRFKSKLKQGLNTITLFATDTTGNASVSKVIKIKRK